ncbi:MAG: IS66 family transposase [Pirellulales bacterium]
MIPPDDRTSLSRAELLVALRQSEMELAAHKERLRELDIALQTKEAAMAKLAQEKQDLELAYNELIRRAFYKRSERYLENPAQLRLDLGDTPESADAAAGLAEAVEELEQTIPEHQRRRPKPKQRDEKLPAHLPRYEVLADAPDAIQHCPEHGPRVLLPESMWDTTETLEFERPVLRVRVVKYRKYACQDQPQCGVSSPARPTALVEGNKYDSSVAAQIINAKYGFHLPLYRQQDEFAGSGWTPSRSTQCNILARGYEVIQPLLDYWRSQVLLDGVIACDDTSVVLLYPKTMPELDLNDLRQRRIHEVYSRALKNKDPSITAKMWVYRGASVKLNLFDFTVSRHRDGPEMFLADYRGTLLGDCWSGFESIVVASGGAIVRAACNAHARRNIFKSAAYPDDRKQLLRWYRELYAIHDRAKLLPVDERVTLHRAESQPIWDAMRAWLEETEHRTTNVILPKSDLGKALQYLRNHWKELRLYLEDGRIPIDNNDAEQLMRQIAVGRKNWLFAGSMAGGQRSAAYFTLVSSALRSDLDVWWYVKDVLDQLLAGSTDYESLLPWNWAEQHPDAIRQYRVEERRDRVQRQQTRRAARRQLRS